MRLRRGAPLSHYRRHVFMCVNVREDGACCQDWDSESMLRHFRRRLKGIGMHGAGRVRVNKSGCMDRCAEGPILVVYPDAVWYRYEGTADLDEILEEHILGDRPVERLRI